MQYVPCFSPFKKEWKGSTHNITLGDVANDSRVVRAGIIHCETEGFNIGLRWSCDWNCWYLDGGTFLEKIMLRSVRESKNRQLFS